MWTSTWLAASSAMVDPVYGAAADGGAHGRLADEEGPAAPAGRVLVVDDEPNICRLLSRYLGRQGYEVGTAGSFDEAVPLLRPDLDLVLTDLRLPGKSGLDLLIEVRARAPGTRTILMSAHADVHSAATAIEYGVDQLILKPFELEALGGRVGEAVARRREEKRSQEERKNLESHLRQRDAESRMWVLRAAHALAAAVEAKDEYTAGHGTRVTSYAQTIAEVTGEIDPVRFGLAGGLHDVGKIGVPDLVLNKPGRLTEDELILVRKHPVTGSNILQPLIDDPLVLGVVRWHHERWDGLGYPDGLGGERIPLPARVLAVADALDAMTSHRAYRSGLPWQRVVAEIRSCSGGQFDPHVVRAFDEALPRLEEQYLEFARSFRGVPGPVA